MKLQNHDHPGNPQAVAAVCQPEWSATGAHGGGGEHEASEHEIAQLGMWLFLATEVLMFGGLFCLYAVFHAKFPAAFEWGRAQLDVGWGLINTIILLLSSLTVAMALYSAQTNRRNEVGLFLTLTVMCGVMFLGVKTIEYQHKFHAGLLWGERFSYKVPGSDAADKPAVEQAAALSPALARGKRVYELTCAVCHGREGQGVAGSGLPLAGSAFLGGLSDGDAVAFVKRGRAAGDPDNQTGIAMPANGGNPSISERDLGLVIAYLRTFKPAEGAATLADAGQFREPQSVIAKAPQGPTGVSPWVTAGLTQPPAAGVVAAHARPASLVPPPEGIAQFFSIYFTMTGLHALHLVIGIGVMLWLFVRSFRRPFHPRDCTPLHVGGMYWHLVDVIWILLFPLLYLVH